MLDYSNQQPKSNWPIGWYVAALVWAFVTLHVVGTTLESYSADRIARVRTQVPLLLCAAGRLVWARHRAERNRGWIFYIAILVFAVPIWYMVAPPIASFARSYFGGPLIP